MLKAISGCFKPIVQDARQCIGKIANEDWSTVPAAVRKNSASSGNDFQLRKEALDNDYLDIGQQG